MPGTPRGTRGNPELLGATQGNAGQPGEPGRGKCRDKPGKTPGPPGNDRGGVENLANYQVDSGDAQPPGDFMGILWGTRGIRGGESRGQYLANYQADSGDAKTPGDFMGKSGRDTEGY